jgi:hypothetical protein
LVEEELVKADVQPTARWGRWDGAEW